MTRKLDATAFGDEPIIVAIPPMIVAAATASRRTTAIRCPLSFSFVTLCAIPIVTGIRRAAVAVLEIHIERMAAPNIIARRSHLNSPFDLEIR